MRVQADGTLAKGCWLLADKQYLYGRGQQIYICIFGFIFDQFFTFIYTYLCRIAKSLLNNMRYIIILVLLALVANFGRSAPVTTSTTPQPSDEESCSEEECPNDPLKEGLFRLLSESRSRAELRQLLLDTVDIIDKKKPISARQRNIGYNPDARTLGRALLGDPTFGSSTSNQSSQEVARDNDPDYCEMLGSNENRQVSLDVMRKIVEMKSQGKSHADIKKRYPRYWPKYFNDYQRCVAQGGSRRTRMQEINDFVRERFTEARANNRPVHDYMLRRWAMTKAEELGANDFFAASHTWLYKFKKNNKIVARKITKYRSEAERNREDERDASIEQFYSDFESTEHHYSRRMIWNYDQSGFNYGISNLRTLEWQGRRDVYQDVRSHDRRTHSYTIQPIISRTGRLIGRLLLCMREPSTGRFGPNIQTTIDRLERDYGNVRVYASKSGKMSRDLMVRWLKDVLHPALQDNLLPIDTDTEIDSDLEQMSIANDDVFDPERNGTEGDRRCYETRAMDCLSTTNRSVSDCLRRASDRCYNQPHTLLLGDSWSVQANEEFIDRIRQYGVRFLRIPEGTTGDLQPLDVIFLRQYKKFFKRVFDEALYEELESYVSSREGIVNIHSLIYNQISSENYTDMVRYSWHKTDPSFHVNEMSIRPVPRMVAEIQFDGVSGKCEHHDSQNGTCTKQAFIRCSHCGKKLCIHHFLQRVCFHSNDGQMRAGPSGSTTQQRQQQISDTDDDDDDSDFDPDLFRNRPERLTTTERSV